MHYNFYWGEEKEDRKREKGGEGNAVSKGERKGIIKY